MRKTALFLSLLMSICFVSNAQYTMLFDFNSGSDLVHNFDTKTQTMYYILEYNAQTAHFYNQDFSFYKSVTAPTIEGYEIYMGHAFKNVSTDVFNADALIEFSFIYHRDLGSMSSVFIFNENGYQIAVYDSAQIREIYMAKNGQIRMDLQKYEWPSVVSNTQTYLLQESPNSINPAHQKEYIQPAYPNPSNTSINLPYSLEAGQIAEMEIYDMQGNLIDTFKIGSHFDQIMLNTSTYQPGMYIYRYNKKSEQFIVN